MGAQLMMFASMPSGYLSFKINYLLPKNVAEAFDLAITDMTMPNLKGDELSRRLIDIRSDIPIIICTGYSERLSEDKAEKLGIKGFAMKPLVMKELAELIQNVLHSSNQVSSRKIN